MPDKTIPIPQGLSPAIEKLANNFNDIIRLIDIHEAEVGTGPGKKHGVEVLNRSAIVTLTAYWEAYCEDLLADVLEALARIEHHDALPGVLKAEIGRGIRVDKDDRAAWKLASNGWRKVIRTMAKSVAANPDTLNTPKSYNVDELFNKHLGCKPSESWTWSRMPVPKAREKLNKMISLRGDIAHRGRAAESVRKSAVYDYTKFIFRIAERTDRLVADTLRDAMVKGAELRQAELAALKRATRRKASGRAASRQ